MTRKNKDWSVSLDQGIKNTEIIRVFFDECGLEPYSHNSINYSVIGIANDDRYQGWTDKHTNHFTIPSQWAEARQYICEIEEEKKGAELVEGRWYKFQLPENNITIGRFEEIDGNTIVLLDMGDKYYEHNVEDWVHLRYKHLAEEATSDEIETHLIRYAKDLYGKMSHISIINNESQVEALDHTSDFNYDYLWDTLYYGSSIVYSKGKWAYRAEEKKTPLEDLIAKYEKESVKHEFIQQFIEDLKKLKK